MDCRISRRCDGIAVTSGERCRCKALPDERYCALHLPRCDPRRQAAVDSIRRRTNAYWRRWWEAKAAAVGLEP
jgi:hypothetical protein